MAHKRDIIVEHQIRELIKVFLLEDVNPVDDFLGGRKFAFEEGGQPAFVIFAENIGRGESLIRRYSQMPLTIFNSGMMSLTGPSKTGGPVSPSRQMLDSVLKEESGWRVEQSLKPEFERLRSVPGEFFIISKSYDNLKKPTKIATSSGQEKFAKFECTLSIPETVKNLFSRPDSQEFMQAAACCYRYANGPESLALAAGIGGAIGAAVGGTGAGAVTAEIGGAGAPVGAVPGFFIGAGAGAASVDAMLRLPVLIWSAWNKKWPFAAANLVIIVLDLVTLGTTAFTKEAAKKSPSLLKWIPSFIQFVIEFAAPVFADTAIQVQKDILSQALQDIIDEKVSIKELLAQSESELKSAIKTQYPGF
jgi:hypothetical protein